MLSLPKKTTQPGFFGKLKRAAAGRPFFVPALAGERGKTMKVLAAREMRMVEAAAVADGLDYLRLMENAGSAAARAVRALTPVRDRRVTVLCGRGNNGGDGFVIARRLLEEGADVTVVLMAGRPAGLEAEEMLSRIEGSAVSILSLESEPYVVSSTVRDAQVVVDAVYGIGFHGNLPDHMRGLFRLVNQSPALKVAVDIPSGLDGDTGLFDPDALRADYTVTFTAMKPGLINAKAAAIYGRVQVAAIGIDDRLVDQYAAGQTIIDFAMVKECFAPRRPESNKGDYGRLLCVCGSYGMAGAAVLAARAALRCGAGLVTLALPRSIYAIAAGQLPEAVFLPLPETVGGQTALAARALLRARATAATALLLGCGLGVGEEARGVVADLLASAPCPIVLDADGINAAAGHIDIGKTARAPVVLTPHPGEMARLACCTVDDVQQDRLGIARRYADDNGVILVLKGSKTVIAAPDRPLLVNMTGNPGMATGGSGDVLAGMIASFIAQGMDPYRAAMCAVHLHGLAGDRAAARLSQHAMLPTDMIGELGGLFLELEK